MFSKFMKSARSFIADSPEPETTKSPRRAITVEPSMVTPRRSIRVQALTAEEEQLTDENSIHVYVPTSSVKKRKRAQEEEMSDNDVFVTPMTSKKRKLPVRGKGVKSALGAKAAKDTHPVVEIMSRPVASQELALVVEEEDQEEDDEPEAVEAKLPATTPSKAPSKHRRFASEEPVQEFSTPREMMSPVKNTQEDPIVIDNEDSEEESDDEGPEAVDTQQAAKAIQLKEMEASQAAKDQTAATRKKRKERDDNLKKQSENGKKRKVELENAEEMPIADDDEVLESAEVAEAPEVTSEGAEEEESMTLENLPTYQRKRHISDLQRNAIPELLPAEYLEDTDSTNLVLHEPVINEQQISRKTKFRDLVERQPKDRRRGSTTYRVSKAQSTNLAPKVAYQARSVKEAWLQGRIGASGGANRKPFSSGFLRK